MVYEASASRAQTGEEKLGASLERFLFLADQIQV